MSGAAGLRSRLAPLAKTVLLHAGGYAAIRRVRPSRRVAILRYHAICGPEGYAYASPGICISPEAFDAHCAYLAGRYRVLGLDEVVARIRDERPLPDNAVTITFDDGYADNLPAARTLHRHGLSATFFITAGCLAGGRPFWPAEIRGLLAAVRTPRLELDLPGEPVVIATASAAERDAAVGAVTRLIKSQPIPVRDAILEQLREAADRPALPEAMLSWTELAQMRDLGMTIGAHTMTHPNLPSAGLDAAREELTASRTRLEGALATPVTLMSYPNGGAERYFTPELQWLAKDCGYTAAATSRNAFAGPESDLYALERVEVEERLEDLVFALEVERFAFRPPSPAGGRS